MPCFPICFPTWREWGNMGKQKPDGEPSGTVAVIPEADAAGVVAGHPLTRLEWWLVMRRSAKVRVF
jgi:hypothetical protein